MATVAVEAASTILRITQTKSAVGAMKRHRATLRTLGLHGIGSQVERPDSPSLRGMLHSVRHLVGVSGLGEPAGNG